MLEADTICYASFVIILLRKFEVVGLEFEVGIKWA